MNLIRWVLQDVKTKEYIAIDVASGGYPYRIKEFNQAHIWNSEEDASSYQDKFKEDWQLVEVFIRTEVKFEYWAKHLGNG